MSNYLLAIQYYEQAIPIMRRLGLGDKLSDIYYLLPTLYIQLNKPAGEVMKIIKEAIEINSILYGDNNKKSAYMLTVMADYSADTCNHSESLSWI